MAFKIGFMAQENRREAEQSASAQAAAEASPRKSLVQVQFPDRGNALAYYNDQFDLHPGDAVYVDGKLEGQLGRVVGVNYNFRIKLSDYKRVIALVDTDVHGRLLMAGSYFLTFDRNVLPREKVRLWFMAPEKPEDIYASGSDDTFFELDHISAKEFSEAVAQRGQQYYLENRVCYLCLDGSRGYAIVCGGSAYEVEFTYRNGCISSLTCSCFCNFRCKHAFAAMQQLREVLDAAQKYGEPNPAYFAAIDKASMFRFCVSGKQEGSITL